MRKLLLVIAGLLANLLVNHSAAQEPALDRLRLPAGFSVAVYAEIENPRQLALGAGNTVFADYSVLGSELTFHVGAYSGNQLQIASDLTLGQADVFGVDVSTVDVSVDADTAIGTISHPAGEVQFGGPLGRPGAKPDALHAAAYARLHRCRRAVMIARSGGVDSNSRMV